MDEEIKKRATELLTRLDMDTMRKHIRELEAESMHENFWKDPETGSGRYGGHGLDAYVIPYVHAIYRAQRVEDGRNGLYRR